MQPNLQINMATYDIIAKTQFGFEAILAKELKSLGATSIEVLNRAVKYRGDDALLYKSNLCLRTALKILKPIAIFEANNEQELYDKVKKIRWDAHFGVNQTFAIDGTTKSYIFNHSKYIALKTKDAIADQFREKYGKRPSVDTVNPNLRINIHISDRDCTISLDSTGTSLDRRGYRLSRTEAPINEVLAAGIIELSGWDKVSDFYDPMCGSGTFAIEAALMAANVPIGALRNFAFEQWNNFKPNLWEEVRRQANDKIRPIKCKIFASDIDTKALSTAKENAKKAGVYELINFKEEDFFQSSAQSEKGWMVMNPPYGERLAQDEIVTFYKEIGSRCKQHYQGFEASIISSNLEALKFFGLKPSLKTVLFNGALECKLHQYSLYKGSREGKE